MLVKQRNLFFNALNIYITKTMFVNKYLPYTLYSINNRSPLSVVRSKKIPLAPPVLYFPIVAEGCL